MHPLDEGSIEIVDLNLIRVPGRNGKQRASFALGYVTRVRVLAH
jgi:hypothetical protein